jgi:hypothetical protein
MLVWVWRMSIAMRVLCLGNKGGAEVEVNRLVDKEWQYAARQ